MYILCYNPYWNSACEIEHHGVLGMKWGVRRYQNKDGSLTSEGKKRYKNLKESQFNKKSNLKRCIIIGASVAAAGLTVYGIYRYKNLSKDRLSNSMIDKGLEFISNLNDIESDKNGIYTEFSDLKRKLVPTTIEDDMKIVSSVNMGKQSNNCALCSVAMELRHRGYDVVPRQIDDPTHTRDFYKWFKGFRAKEIEFAPKPMFGIKKWSKENYDKLRKVLKEYGDGARGFVRSSIGTTGYGHAVYWTVKDGQVDFYDAQRGIKNPTDFFRLSRKKFTYARLDTCGLKDAITETCINRDKR